MAIVKEDKNGLWFHIKLKRHRADSEAFNFGRIGEFSPYTDLAFIKHLRRLDRLKNNPVIRNMNGGRIKVIREAERLWY